MNNNTKFFEEEFKKLIDMSKEKGELSTLAYIQCLQNLNIMNQMFMKNLFDSKKDCCDKEFLKELIREVCKEVLHELEAEVVK